MFFGRFSTKPVKMSEPEPITAAKSSPCTLLLIAKNEPLEGAIFDALATSENGVLVYNIKTADCLAKGTSIDVPVSNLPENSLETLNFQRFLTSAIERDDIGDVILVGMAAAAFWSKLGIQDIRPYVIVPKQETSFSSRRIWKVDEFRNGCRDRYDFFFDDEFDFTAAISKGSLSRHFTYDVPVRNPIKYLRTDRPRENLAILMPHEVFSSEKDCDIWRNELDQLSERYDFDYELISDKSVFSHTDFLQKRNFAGTLRYRFGNFTKIGVISFGRNSNAVLKALRNELDRIVVENTSDARRFTETTGLKYTLSPSADLVQTLISLKNSSSDYADESPDECFASQLRAKAEKNTSPLYEELSDMEPNNGARFSVFFSVGGINFEIPSARHQRVRNMFRALRADGEGQIVITSDRRVLSRRLQYIDELISKGAKPSVFYGENSTSPITDVQALADLEALLRLLRGSGAKLGWFVRDVHFYFADIAPSLGEPRKIEAMRAFGWIETDILAKNVDLFFAPSAEACRVFKRVLGLDNVKPSPKWKALPPGVRDKPRIPKLLPQGPEGGITFVYTGGLGTIYQLDAYVEAAREFAGQKNVYFDFIVRESEAKDLAMALKRHKSGQFRIITGDFDRYRPRTDKVVGILLLAGEYAALAMPYKTMSYIERGFPILAYSGTTVGDFVAKNKLGQAIEPGAPAIVAALSQFIAESDNRYALKPALRKHAWEKRAASIRTLLARA